MHAVVLWMTGGPGCSSELAVFYENGPYSINHDMTLTETKYGWDRFHTTIFVDQPINTGFSYSNVRLSYSCLLLWMGSVIVFYRYVC